MKTDIKKTFKSVILLLALLMALSSCTSGGSGEFVPPEFDKNAKSGTPSDGGKYYVPFSQQGFEFSIHICNTIVMSGKNATVNFTNDSTNSVWLKIRVYEYSVGNDGSAVLGSVLGESGLIKPGEYLESVKLKKSLKAGATVSIKVMAYEPQTYYSKGSFSLNTNVVK